VQRNFFLNHSEVEFYFKQSVNDFIVTEVPLYEFSGEGEHLVLKVRKKNVTTWQMLDIFAKTLGIKSREIGYAGLKDKNAMTIQHISINKKYEERLKDFESKDIKILETTYHKNKIKIGHLKGNKFFIRLKKTNPLSATKIDEAIKAIKTYGIPNFFGFQRFGITQENYNRGKEIVEGKLKIRDRKEKKFLIGSYQSYMFNSWLSKRLEISKIIESCSIKELQSYFKLDKNIITAIKNQPHRFKLLQGDLMHHYPHGRVFELSNMEEDSKRFVEKDVVPTGILSGSRVSQSKDLAFEYEKDFLDEQIPLNGTRKFAWIFPKEIETNYREKDFWYELNFYLPKGSYATVLIEELAHKELLSEANL